MTQFKFPDVGEGISEGTLQKWCVKVGDQIKANDILAEVETDKAVVEIPSPQDGKIAKLHGNESEKVHVGDVFVTFDEGTASENEEPSKEQKDTKPPQQDSQQKEEDKKQDPEEKHGAGVVGDIPEYQESEQQVPEHHYFYLKNGDKVRSLGELKQALQTIDDDTFSHHTNEVRNDFVDWIQEVHHDQALAEQIKNAASKDAMIQLLSIKTQKAKAMPGVRKLAEEKNIDLSTINGSGKEGEIVREDLDSTHEKRDYPGEIETVKIEGIRKTIAQRMLNAQKNTAFLTHTDEADVTDLLKIQKQYKAQYQEKGVHLTPLAFIVKIMTKALQKFPYANAEFAQDIILKKYYNLGIAVDTQKGLLVPNIKNADQLSVIDIAKEIQFLALKAREGKVTMQEMSQGTFTITNVGSVGGLFATPIINYPEVAILALGRTQDLPRYVGDDLQKRKILPLSLTFDHRIMDGAYAAAFVTEIKNYLEDPDRLLLE